MQVVDFEKKYNVFVLYSCLSGSRGYGFPGPDSDEDVRHVYINPFDWYLSLHQKQRDTITDGETVGWELGKYLRLALKGNVTPHEWLKFPALYEHGLFTGLRAEIERTASPYVA